ncbi:Ig-like domain-containing protein [uncultured Tenacibaculum sp.]|uniref:Ig-like domain-containing protein n=1 Tax=uncultured Tenacibaculum sp. TaxID=174713 RepID=UPI0026275027|nr:Ig-like domain-containing protein [uncultured Tenacibaculum sp.]
MKKLLLLFTIYLTSLLNSYAQDVPFTQRLLPNGSNVRGDITFVSNNILNREDSSFSANDPYNGTGSNGQLNIQYIDVDDDPTTFSSSSALLNLPLCSRVTFAGLYWSAVYPYETWEGEAPRSGDFRNIKFRLPGQSYQDITSDEVIYDNGIATQRPYLCFKDLTSEVSSLSSPNGDYFAANIRGTIGADQNNGLGGAAGWVLVIIYENSNETTKNISLFDGFSTVNVSNTSDVLFSGITTTPTGSVRAKALVAALEGDQPFAGDHFQIRGSSGFYTDVFNQVNPQNNFFNSSITQYDNYVIDRTPASENTLGFDVDLFQINNPGNSVIANNQADIQARFTTDSDMYWPFLSAIAVEISEPDLRVVNTIDDGAGNDLSGSVLSLGSDFWYNFEFQNIGNEDATNAVISSRLPKNISIIPSDVIVPSGVNFTYTPPSNANGFRGEVTFSINDNLVQESNSSQSIRFHAQLSSNCSEFTEACSNIIETQAFSNFSGINSGIQVSNKPSVSGVDACNQGIVGGTSFLADTSSCADVTKDVGFCGVPVTLTAADGFATYQWEDSSGTVLGTTQSITVNSLGVYKVAKGSGAGAPAACLPLTESFNVISGFLDFTAFSNDATCTGNDGGITVNVTNGQAPFTYTIIQATGVGTGFVEVTEDSSSYSFVGLTAGAYEVQVTDANGCTSLLTLVLSEFPPLTVTPLTVSQFNCFSNNVANNANIIINTATDITGGTGTYTSIELFNENGTPGNTSDDVKIDGVDMGLGYMYEISDFNGGSFYARIVDSNGCIAFSPVVNIDPLDVLLGLTIDQVDPINCSNTGEKINITYNSSLGSINADIVISDSTGVVIETINNVQNNVAVTNNSRLTSGIYSIKVINPITGCEINEVYSVDDVQNYTTNIISSTPGACFGDNNASLTLSIEDAGGNPYTGTYNYEVFTDGGASSGGISVATSNPLTINDLSSGVYLVEITMNDFPFCVLRTQEVVIDGPNAAIATSTVVSDDVITVEATGGIPPYEYALDGTTFTTNNIFIVPNAGEYNVSVRDVNGCTVNTVVIVPDFGNDLILADDAVVTLSGSPLIIDILSNDTNIPSVGSLTVNNPSNGSVTIDDSGTVDDLSDDIITYTPDQDFVGLDSFTYTVCDLTTNYCDSATVFVTVDPILTPLTVAFNSTNISCSGDDNGIIEVSATGGIEPYSYALSSESSVISTNPTGVFSNLFAANYNVEVTDSVGNKENIEVVITEPTQILVGITSSSVNCNGGNDGFILVVSTGGSGNYTYEISSEPGVFKTGNLFPELPAADYVVTVKDDFGCTVSRTVTISEPEKLEINPVVDGNTVTVNAINGVPPYKYAIDGGPITTTNVFTNLSEGTHEVSVTDFEGCFSSISIEISNQMVVLVDDAIDVFSNTPSIIDVFANDVSIPTESDMITTTPLNGSLTIDDSGTTTDPSDDVITYTPNQDFVGVDSFTYTICDFGGNSCGTATVLITVNPQITPISVALTSSDVICNGESNGTIQAVANGGIPPYTYKLIDSFSTTIDNNTNGFFVNIVAGYYTVEVTDSTGSIIIDNVTIFEPELLQATLVTENVSCNGEGDGTITVNAIGGNGNYVYEISSNPGRFQTENTFTNLIPGFYNITVLDSSGCISVIPATIEEPETLFISSVDIRATGRFPSGRIKIGAEGGTPRYKYSINGGTFKRSNRFLDLEDGSYIILVKDANGCISNPLTVRIDKIEINNTVNQVLDILEASYKNAVSYQWINVDDNTRIPGANQAAYKPTESGRYQVEMVINETSTRMQNNTVIRRENNQVVLSPVIEYKAEVLSVEDVEEKILKVYPNPTSERLILPVNLMNKSYKIYSIIGKEVKSDVISSEEIQVNELARGVYLLKVDGYQPLRFIKK